MYLVESLSTVKSALLVCDLPAADDIMTEFFTRFLALAQAPLAKNLELGISDILVQLVDECEEVPAGVTEALLGALQGDAGSAEPVEGTAGAARIAAGVCRATQDRLQRHVAHYFSEAIAEAQDEEDEDAASRRAALERVHMHIVRVCAAAPSLLISVVPQLEEELRAEVVQVRHLATHTLGAMFGHVPALGAERRAGGVARMFPPTWRAWLARATDRSAAVRTEWIARAADVLVQYAELAEELVPVLAARLTDPDERARAAVAAAVGALDYEALCHTVPTSLLQELAERGKDRRAAVRDAALGALARAYSLGYPELERGGDAAAERAFAWIPAALLRCCYTGVPEVTASVAAAVDAHVLPAPGPGAEALDAWTTRLLHVAAPLDEDTFAGLLALTNLRLARPSAYDAFVAACERKGAGDELASAVRACAAALGGDVARAAADLAALAERADRGVLQALKRCFDPRTPLQESAKARADVLGRVRALDPALVETMRGVVRGGAYPILNVAVVLPLLAAARPGGSWCVAARLLRYVGKEAPQLLAPHAAEIRTRALESGAALPLELLARLAAHRAHRVALDATGSGRLAELAGAEDAGVAGAAAKVLACVAQREAGASARPASAALQRAADRLDAALASPDEAAQAAALAVLAQLFKHAPDAVDLDADALVDRVLQGVLLAPWSAQEAGEAGDAEWVPEERTPTALRTHLLALKVLTRRCVALGEAAHAAVLEPVLRLLWAVLSGGEARSGLETPAWARARMRLGAALSVVRLARCAAFQGVLVPRLARLALALQDECYAVRSALLHRVLVLLTRRELPPAFNALVYIVALDPEEEVRTMVASYTRRNAAALPPETRTECFDMAFVRFLHLLAHHPDLDLEAPAEVAAFARYIDFFLACNATEANAALLEHLAAQLKTVATSADRAQNDRLYVLSELAQHLVRRLVERHAWTPSAVHDRVALPNDILHPLPEAEADSVRSQRFLEKDTLRIVDETGHKNVRLPRTDPGPAHQQKRAHSTKDGAPKRARHEQRAVV